MTKTTYKRKYLFGGLRAVSDGKSMTIMAGTVIAGSQAWPWSSS